MRKWIIAALVLPVVLFVSYKGYRYIKNEMTKDVLDIQYVNKPAPDVKGITANGEKWSLRSQKGKNVIIIFWASWCRDCIKEIPEIIKLNNKIKNDPSIVMVSANLDTDTEKAISFIKEKKINYPVLIDKYSPGFENEFSKAFKIIGAPSIWVVNKEGVVIAQRIRHIKEILPLIEQTKIQKDDLSAQSK